MIAAEDQRAARRNAHVLRPLNVRQLHDQLLQPPQRTQRLGDAVKARLRPLSRAHTPSSSTRRTSFMMSP